MQHESPLTNTSTDTTTSISSFRMSVNVRLCGSIPRKDMKCLLPSSTHTCGAPCSLKDCLTSQGSACVPPLNDGLFLASTNGPTSTLSKTATPLSIRLNSVVNALSTSSSLESGASALSNCCQSNTNTSIMRGKQQQPHLVLPQQQQPSPALGLVVEPPSWAVPARGESRLEPVCDSVGRQTAVDLTARACFRIGRSPNMDVQLLHATSSRRHALLFHHSNGSCYVVDCGSAHGTYVNGVRIASPSNGGVVVPHKVKRGALIRFGGPGAPCFLLKSFSFHLNDINGLTSPDMGELVRRNTRLNALGRTAAERCRDSLFITIDSVLGVSRKRSFDSLDSRDTLEVVESQLPCGKRLRCSSPPPSPEEPPLRLVSPDLPSIITKRVTFSEEPPKLFYPALVTPEELSCEEDN